MEWGSIFRPAQFRECTQTATYFCAVIMGCILHGFGAKRNEICCSEGFLNFLQLGSCWSGSQVYRVRFHRAPSSLVAAGKRFVGNDLRTFTGFSAVFSGIDEVKFGQRGGGWGEWVGGRGTLP